MMAKTRFTVALTLVLALAGTKAASSKNPLDEAMKPHLDPANDRDQAILEAEKAASDKPDDPQSHILLGNAYLGRGWPGLAADSYDRAIDIAPDNAVAWNNLGLAELLREKDGKANRAFKRAIEIDPAYADAHYNIATIFERRRQFSAALSHYRLALTAKPGLADRKANPQARESALLSVAVLSLYKDTHGSMALAPEAPPAPAAPASP